MVNSKKFKFDDLPDTIIQYEILSKVPIKKIYNVNFNAYERHLSENGYHVYDYNFKGIELFSKLCDVIKNVIYWNIPEHFLIFPTYPERLYFKNCKDIIDISKFKFLKRLTLINTNFKSFNIDDFPNLEYLRIELFNKKYDFDPNKLNKKDFKNVETYISVNGKVFKNKSK